MRWWWLVVKLDLQKELSVEVIRLNINFSPELNDISKHHKLLSVPNKERFGVKRIILINDIWLYEPMKRDFIFLLLLLKLRVFALVMIRVSIVHLVPLLIENLDLHEVHSLLDEIDISEVL